MPRYKVTVRTGKVAGAGTDANVHIILYGKEGDSGLKQLDSLRNDFEKNQTDEYVVDTPPLGTLLKLQVGHDDTGVKSDWFLDKILVYDPDEKKTYTFSCNNWFSKTQGDQKTERDLFPEENKTSK